GGGAGGGQGRRRPEHGGGGRRDGLDDRGPDGEGWAGEVAAGRRGQGERQGPEGTDGADVGRGRRPRGGGVRTAGGRGGVQERVAFRVHALALCRAGRPDRRRPRSPEA